MVSKKKKKRALTDYKSNDNEYIKKLAFLAYKSDAYQVKMYGVFLFGYLSEQDDILAFMRAAQMICCIPMDEEHEDVKKKLKVPPTYKMPVFIGIRYADPAEKELEQAEPDYKKQLHFGSWK